MWLFIFGLVCLLLVIGSFTEAGSIAFTIGAIVVLGALGFVVFVVAMGASMLS